MRLEKPNTWVFFLTQVAGVVRVPLLPLDTVCDWPGLGEDEHVIVVVPRRDPPASLAAPVARVVAAATPVPAAAAPGSPDAADGAACPSGIQELVLSRAVDVEPSRDPVAVGQPQLLVEADVDLGQRLCPPLLVELALDGGVLAAQLRLHGLEYLGPGVPTSGEDAGRAQDVGEGIFAVPLQGLLEVLFLRERKPVTFRIKKPANK